MTAGKKNLPSSKETHITDHYLGYKPSLLIKCAVGLDKVLEKLLSPSCCQKGTFHEKENDR